MPDFLFFFRPWISWQRAEVFSHLETKSPAEKRKRGTMKVENC